MTAEAVSTPFTYFNDPDIGRPIFNGYLYFGEVNTDPELNPVPVYRLEENNSLTPITQPVRTSAGGIPLDDFGNPSILAVDGNYSLNVYRSNGTVQGSLAYSIVSARSETLISPTGSVVREKVVLADGQLIVTFTLLDANFSDLYISGPNADRGQLSTTEYTIDSPTQITLMQSYPAGTCLEAQYFNATGDPGDTVPSAVTTETVALSPGQTLVTFLTVDTSICTYYLSGLNADNGLIVEPSDYAITSPATITLTNSQPAGTVVTAIQIQTTVVPTP